MFLDTTLPDALITHMLNDAQPVVILTRGQDKFRDLPTLDVLSVAGERCREESRRAGWMTRRNGLRPSFTRAEPPGCPRAWSARTQVT